MGVHAPFGERPAGAQNGSGGDPARDPSLARTQVAGTPNAAGGRPGYNPLTDPHHAMATIVDVPAFSSEEALRRAQTQAGAAGGPGSKPQGTLLGVARPGIAPLRPGVAKTPADEPPPGYQPLSELGATQKVPNQGRAELRAALAVDKRANTHPLARLRLDGAKHRAPKHAAPPKKPGAGRAIWVIGAAVVLTGVAVAVAFLWPSAPPLRAQVRAAEGGAEVLDLTCQSCPDGTVLKIRDREGTVEATKATVPLGSPLAIGDTPLKVAIDRPGGGRDETVTLPVRVAYRIRPDVTTLDGDHPSIQIVVEAMDGAKVSLDGEDVPLREGRAVKTIDVTKDLTGESADAAATLSRKVSFEVKPPDAELERGSVSVSVPVLPLTIEAPGPSIVTDKPTFLLAGRTLQGAEIVVAGNSLGTTKDGAFSQTMNVSSVGATVIEVRARMGARAPRLMRLSVERVTSIEAAAAEFTGKSPLDFAALGRSTDEAIGKRVAFVGEVVELRASAASVTLLVRPAAGCPAPGCIARVVVGRPDLEVARGDQVKVFGTFSGTVQHDGARVPDVAASFVVKAKAAGPAKIHESNLEF